MTTSADKSAHELLEVVPIVIRVIRAQMRRHRSLALTVPQFRALVFIGDNPGTSLSQVAEFSDLELNRSWQAGYSTGTRTYPSLPC
jgi:hypothetical protein